MKKITYYLLIAATLIIFTSGLTYSVFQHFTFLEDLSLASSIVVAVVEIFGLFAIWYQLKKQKDVEVANFLLQFEQSFLEHKPIFGKIEMSKDENLLKREDVSDIVRYLTFYESLYYFIEKGVLDIEVVDDMFGYRFFLAVHNDFIQENNLYPFAEYYQNIFSLYEQWYAFRVKNKLRIPMNFNRLNLEELRDYREPGILRSGQVTSHSEHEHSKKVDYQMRLISQAHLDELLDLQQKVYDLIDNDEIFQLTTREEYEERLTQGRIIGVFVEDKMIAFLALYFPDEEDPENLGRDIRLPKSHLSKVAYFESIAVDPGFRGNGLQRKLQEEAFALAERFGYRHMMATVSHLNYWSLKNMLSFGFHIRSLKEKYGGKLRYITHMDALKSTALDYQNKVELPNKEVSAQQQLYKKNYHGFELHKLPGEEEFLVSLAGEKR